MSVSGKDCHPTDGAFFLRLRSKGYIRNLLGLHSGSYHLPP